MKTVFTSREIAHVWANRGAPLGRCASSMSFEGDAFSSYRTVIARRIASKGREAYVVDSASFSVTTSSHQTHVRCALRDPDKVFHVHSGRMGQDLLFTPGSLRDYYLKEFREVGEQSKFAWKRAESFLHRLSRLDSAVDVCEFFGLASAKLKAIRTKQAGAAKEARALSDAQQEKFKARRDAAAEKRRERWARLDRERSEQEARNIAQAITAAEAIRDGAAFTGKEKFSNWGSGLDYLQTRPDLVKVVTIAAAAFEAAKPARWIAGEDVTLGYDAPTLLRTEDPEMVTSRGARLPLADAERTYRFASLMRARGWHKNGESHAIGMYQLDAVNEQGVVAGCHRVTWAEIERFAALQGWSVPASV